MDGISAAASIIAVRALVGNTIKAAKKIHEFWRSVEDAPEDFRAITRDLKILISILEKIDQTICAPKDSDIELALVDCKSKIDNLRRSLQQYDPSPAAGSKQRRKWRSIKATFKATQIKKIQRSIDETEYYCHLPVTCLLCQE